MKNFLIYSTAIFVGIMLAMAIVFMFLIMILPAILAFTLNCWWIMLTYVPFFAYLTVKNKNRFFDKMK